MLADGAGNGLLEVGNGVEHASDQLPGRNGTLDGVEEADELLVAVLGPMVPVLFAPGSGPRGGRPAVDDLVCLDTVIDPARGTRWRDIRTRVHGVSRDTVRRRLRFWVDAGVFGEIMDLLVLRGVLGGAFDLSRIRIDSRSIRARRGTRTPGSARPIAAGRASSTT